MPLEQSIIGKGLVIKDDIKGTGSLFIDGKVKGSINLIGGRVTVGVTGRVDAGMNASKNLCITADEIVIMGDVRGNVSAANRVEICAEGKLTGNVSTSRIHIEDGGFFMGYIDVPKDEVKGKESGWLSVPIQPPALDHKIRRVGAKSWSKLICPPHLRRVLEYCTTFASSRTRELHG
jgi:cytoskeletal protein CcmA (bactofilin family)